MKIFIGVIIGIILGYTMAWFVYADKIEYGPGDQAYIEQYYRDHNIK